MSLVEASIGALLVAFVIGSVAYIIKGGHQGVREAQFNHMINEEGQMFVAKLTEELREANTVLVPMPIKPADYANLKTADKTNYLYFRRVNYDWNKDPKTLGNGEVPYTQTFVRYWVEPEKAGNATGPWQVLREETQWDTFKKAQPPGPKKVVMRGLDEVMFFRFLEQTRTPGAQGAPAGMGDSVVHIYFKQKRQDDPAKARAASYHLDTRFSVKIRGSNPDR